MPVYEYFCEANGHSIEIEHGMALKFQTWGELCEAAKVDPGETSADTPVERLMYAPQVSTPTGDSELKNMGFTKLVRRDSGVYENVTATGTEKKYMKSGDDSSLPHLHKKIKD